LARHKPLKLSPDLGYEGFGMERRKKPLELERARAAFNMVALHLAGYTYDQIELLRPSNMTPDRLHELLDRKMASLLGKHLKAELISKSEDSPKKRSD
jgi:hypothetical protein